MSAPRPSEVIWAELRRERDEGRRTSLVDEVRAGRLPHRSRLTLAQVAEHVRAGADFRECVRDFLDDLAFAGDDEDVVDRVAQEPFTLPDRRYDAYLAALAEHLCSERGRPAPDWALHPRRFLDTFWLPRTRAFTAFTLVRSPAAFRRRGIFVGDLSSLRRA